MSRILILTAFFLSSISASIAQKSAVPAMLDNVLGGVVTVAIYETNAAKKSLGFRGNSDELAYSKALDLTGAKGSGSGFIIRKNGKSYVITNAHVIQDAVEGSIYIYSVGYKKYAAKVLGGDSFYDIAVLEFTDQPGTEMTSLKFRTSEAQVGEQVYAVGNPLGDYPYTVTDGIISAKNRVRGGLTGKFGFLQSTATVIWGNSGGPLVDASGDVIGINSQIAFAESGDQSIWQPQINFALEAGLSDRLVNDIINNKGLIKRAFLGVEIARMKIDSYYKRLYGSDENAGVNPMPFISAVVPGTPAYETLLPYVGYTIQSINGEGVRNVEEALGILEKALPEAELTFGLIKDGVTVTAKVKARTCNETTMSLLGNYLIRSWGCKASQENQFLSLDFVDRNSYSSYQRRSTEMISTIGKENSLSQDVLFNNNWVVLAAGIMGKNSSNVWKIQDEADLATALRLSGLTGVVDLVLFRKGTDVENENNYIQKRFLLSGEDHTYKETLWY